MREGGRRRRERGERPRRGAVLGSGGCGRQQEVPAVALEGAARCTEAGYGGTRGCEDGFSTGGYSERSRTSRSSWTGSGGSEKHPKPVWGSLVALGAAEEERASEEDEASGDLAVGATLRAILNRAGPAR